MLHKRTIIKVLILLSLLYIVSCHCNNTQKKVIEDDASLISLKDKLIVLENDNLEIIDTIRISQFSDSLFYILLERTEQCKISNIEKVLMTDSLIFVLDINESLFSFDRTGKFLRKISSDCWGFDILEDSKLMFIAKRRKIDIYDFSGERVHQSVRLGPELEGIGNFFAAIDSNTVAISIWNQGIEDNRLVIMSTDGNTLESFPNPEKFNSTSSPLISMAARHFNQTVSRFNNKVYYHPYYSDTLFLLSENKLEPIFIEKKIPKVPLEHRLEYTGNEKVFGDYCINNEKYTTRIFNSKRFYLVIYNLGQISMTLPNYLLYDKITETTYNYKQNLNFITGILHYGFYNDYDGGLAFNPSFFLDEFLIEAHNPLNFKNYYLNGRYIQDCDKNGICTTNHYQIKSDYCEHPERKTILENFIRLIREDSNPVLIIARLKGIN